MRAIVKSFVIVSVVILAGGSVYADELYRETFEQTYDLAVTGSFSLENVNGDVTIEAWERPAVQITAVKSASSPELLQGLKINVSHDGNRVDVDTEYPSTRGYQGKKTHLSVEYTVMVPRQARIDDVDLVNGNLSVEGIEGGVDAESVNGALVLRRCSGSFDLSTVNGGIETRVDRFGSDDEIAIESVNGAIDLYLTGSISAVVHAETVNGSIKDDFGMQVKRGKYVGADLDGSVGGGGGRVNIETVNGKIAIRSW